MLWKCCPQYASKFGKLSSGHRTGKGQFSFQSQRKAMPKNDQTTAQLHSSHTLAKQCSKFYKPGFNNMWTVNFQMFKLDLEKEEPEIKLPTSIGSLHKQESSRKISTSALLTMPKSFTVWITTNTHIAPLKSSSHFAVFVFSLNKSLYWQSPWFSSPATIVRLMCVLLIVSSPYSQKLCCVRSQQTLD